MTPACWRRWHRWIGAVAGLFLLNAGVTGVVVAMTAPRDDSTDDEAGGDETQI